MSHIPESQIPGPPNLPRISAFETQPAPQKSDSELELEAKRAEIDHELIRNALSTMASAIEHQTLELTKFVGRIDDRLDGLDRFQAEFGRRSDGRWTALNERIGALEKILIARFDGIDERLDEFEGLLKNLNQIVSGLRSQSKSAYDMAATAARRSSHPGLDAELHQAVASGEAKAKPDGSPR